ncbi:MAG: hypothetical protein EAZ98_13205 [Oscillatoriales cyanobacterium]|nr:MAG: hypothetical protein EAZ98_13205 [Oscillatoriales cyanobacterium]
MGWVSWEGLGVGLLGGARGISVTGFDLKLTPMGIGLPPPKGGMDEGIGHWDTPPYPPQGGNG